MNIYALILSALCVVILKLDGVEIEMKEAVRLAAGVGDKITAKGLDIRDVYEISDIFSALQKYSQEAPSDVCPAIRSLTRSALPAPLVETKGVHPFEAEITLWGAWGVFFYEINWRPMGFG